MIAKHISMRSLRKSSFALLVRYLTDHQGRSERVGSIVVTNCDAYTLQAAVAEVLATQQMNTRSEADKTYHLLVSFRPREEPDEKTLQAVEHEICKSLGFEGHQRVRVVHNDTDNVHFHLAINKVHPRRHTVHEPYRAYWKLAAACSELERRFGLEVDNHTASKGRSQNRVDDMEHHTGIESLVTWIRCTCLEELRRVSSWEEFHTVLGRQGLEVCVRGNGLVFRDLDGLSVKASTVARDLSKKKLEERFGYFRLSNLSSVNSNNSDEDYAQSKAYKERPVDLGIDTSDLFARYQEDMKRFAELRSHEFAMLKRNKSKNISSAKRQYHARKIAIRRLADGRFPRRFMYYAIRKSLWRQIQAVQRDAKETSCKIFSQYKRVSWVEWLRRQALAGNRQALDVLRCRGRSIERGDCLYAKNKETFVDKIASCFSGITKKGTVVFCSGGSIVRDDGEKVSVSREMNASSIQAALRRVVEQYGSSVSVEGTPRFKAEVIRAAVVLRMSITFADPCLEIRRQRLIGEEKYHEQSTRRQRAAGGTSQNRGRVDRRGVGDARRRASADDGSFRREEGIGGDEQRWRGDATARGKSYFGGVGEVPPPEARNRLRALSQLGVVRFARRGEMLLQSDVSRHVEQQGAKSDNALRRGVDRAGVGEIKSKKMKKRTI
jgi:Relaxase/Mobilisation nuclease domain/Large polyvalent protein-associated domain 7